MELSLIKEVILSLTVFFLSVIGGITGIGISTIITPLLLFLGTPFALAKATSLWVNLWLMAVSVYKKFKTINWKLTFPLVVSAFISAPLGAKVSFFIPEKVQLLMLATFVVLSGLFILFFKPLPLLSGLTHEGFLKVGVLLGLLSGFIGGMLGIGGGIIVNPILIILGMDPILVTSLSSVLVLLSSFGGWITYTLMGHFDWSLAIICAPAAVFGSFLGNRWANRFERKVIRKIVAAFAIFVGLVIYAKAFSI